MNVLTRFQVPDTSTTLLRDVANLKNAKWTAFYAYYQPMMRSYLREYFPSLDADDIIQETFVALSKILPNYEYNPADKGTFHNFLTGILNNKALCAHNKNKRKIAIEERMKLSMEVKGRSANEQSYRDWRESVFEIALEQLLADDTIHDRTKQVFIRTAIKGESIEAVAASLGVKRHVVDCMRSRTLERLRKIVEELKNLC